MTSNHLIVGCPKGFDLRKQIGSAESVKIAMAFAKRSGWHLLREALIGHSVTVELIVGLSFGITEIELLEEWLSLSTEYPGQFIARIAPQYPTFHPKVIIARFKDGSGVGIVGSGNLTQGGQSLNIECGAYLTSDPDIKQLEKWYGDLKGKLLKKGIIEAYRPVYKTAQKQREDSTAAQKLAVLLSGNSEDWYSDDFTSDLSSFLNSADGMKILRDRVDGARRIQAALRIPDFNFTKEGWEEFYRIPDFGRIRLAYPEMGEDIPSLRKTMRILVGSTDDVEKFKTVYETTGKYHIVGMGANQITKILTVYDRKRWPLLNGPVCATLRNYGYEIDWSAAGYLKFAEDMRELLGMAALQDFWALDAFCEAKSRVLKS